MKQRCFVLFYFLVFGLLLVEGFIGLLLFLFVVVCFVLILNVKPGPISFERCRQHPLYVYCRYVKNSLRSTK